MAEAGRHRQTGSGQEGRIRHRQTGMARQRQAGTDREAWAGRSRHRQTSIGRQRKEGRGRQAQTDKHQQAEAEGRGRRAQRDKHRQAEAGRYRQTSLCRRVYKAGMQAVDKQLVDSGRPVASFVQECSKRRP